MKSFKKVLTCICVVAMMFSSSFTAFAAVTLPHAFPEDQSNDYGEATALIIKLQDEGVDPSVQGKIATVDVHYKVVTDFFQPQFIANSNGVWNQFPDEQRTDGIFTYDITGQFKADNTYNEIWIKTGYKNAGAASVEQIDFKDVDGNILLSFGPNSAEVTAETPATTETTTTEAEASETLPQTGTAPSALYILAGATLVMLGIAVKKNKIVGV